MSNPDFSGISTQQIYQELYFNAGATTPYCCNSSLLYSTPLALRQWALLVVGGEKVFFGKWLGFFLSQPSIAQIRFFLTPVVVVCLEPCLASTKCVSRAPGMRTCTGGVALAIAPVVLIAFLIGAGGRVQTLRVDERSRALQGSVHPCLDSTQEDYRCMPGVVSV